MRIYIGDHDPHAKGMLARRARNLPLSEYPNNSPLPLAETIRMAVSRAYPDGKIPRSLDRSVAELGVALLPELTGRIIKPELLFPGDYYGVDAFERLIVGDDDLEQITVAEFVRAIESGYYRVREPALLVGRYHAWGGNGFIAKDIFEWLIHQVPEILVGYGLSEGVGRLQKNRERKLRATAAKWASRRITSPYQLRQWVEKKQAWSPTEIATRLELPEASAEALLTELGYERIDRGSYVLHSSVEALRKRDLWIYYETSDFNNYMDGVDPGQ